MCIRDSPGSCLQQSECSTFWIWPNLVNNISSSCFRATFPFYPNSGTLKTFFPAVLHLYATYVFCAFLWMQIVGGVYIFQIILGYFFGPSIAFINWISYPSKGVSFHSCQVVRVPCRQKKLTLLHSHFVLLSAGVGFHQQI